MLNDIEVLHQPDTNYWMKTAYTIPDTPHANVRPGETGVKTVPINRLVPRSFITNISPGESIPRGAPTMARGIAFGGNSGVATVDLSIDGGKTWTPTRLGKDEGKYGFRQWETRLTLPAVGNYTLMVRCANSGGDVQPGSPNWNPAGFMRNVIESTDVVAN
jgi:Mo-co oxidoreductase dimerisation domain